MSFETGWLFNCCVHSQKLGVVCFGIVRLTAVLPRFLAMPLTAFARNVGLWVYRCGSGQWRDPGHGLQRQRGAKPPAFQLSQPQHRAHVSDRRCSIPGRKDSAYYRSVTKYSVYCLHVRTTCVQDLAPTVYCLCITGALDALMRSRHDGNIRLETPYLVIPYQPSTIDPIHPTLPRPVGASTQASPELLADHADPGTFPTEIINARTLREKAKL